MSASGTADRFNSTDTGRPYAELALEIMPPDHPSRPDFETGVERIRGTLASLEEELNEHLARLRAVLETGTYDPEVWTEIRLTFERVRVLLLAIGKEDDRPRNLAREFVDKFRRHGQYEHARIATQLAEAVIAAGRPTRRHTDEELVLYGVIDYLGRQQEAERQKKIDDLVNEVVSALESKQTEVAIQKAHAVLELGPRRRTARRMRAILTQHEGVAGQRQRAKEARKLVAATPTEIEPIPLTEPQAIAAAAEEPAKTVTSGSGSAEEPVVDGRSVRQRLQEIIRQYEEKDLYQALAGLEALQHERCSAREQKKISKLRRIWTPDRRRLTNDIVREADRLFVLMDERSLSEYRRAQRLNPDEEIAEHIEERIETLERILAE